MCSGKNMAANTAHCYHLYISLFFLKKRIKFALSSLIEVMNFFANSILSSVNVSRITNTHLHHIWKIY